jgi:pilus assembly protein Flp/PilA
MSGAISKIARDASRFVCSEDGATVIEYGLIVSLIFLAIMAAVQNVASQNNDIYSDIQSALDSV